MASSKKGSRRKVVEDLVAAYGQACFYCKRAIDFDDLTIDHYIPKAAGGPDTFENLRPACFKCNQEKADRVPLPDGTLPPRVIQSRKKVATAVKAAVCWVCESGRLLSAGAHCFRCGSHPMPQVRPRYLKAHPKECDHREKWCMNCCLFSDEQRLTVYG